MSAWTDLQGELQEGEVVEVIVFGPWGWGIPPRDNENWEPGFLEPDETPIPFNMRGQMLTPSEARPMMQSWGFYGGFGSPACYATYIWTNQRVLFVTQYDGATSLDSVPRSPLSVMPDMPGS